MTIVKSFLRIPRSIRHINRYREIVFILLKYGLGDFFGYTKSLSFGLFNRKKFKEIIDLRKESSFEKIKLALEELGPTFIKFGQVMSNRPDILPEVLILELEKLQKNVSPFPFSQASKIIDEELKEKRTEYFSEIDPNPLASGSIAQVHKAKLITGEVVVLKIMRPNIAQQIETDIEIMQFLAKNIQRNLPHFSGIDAQAIIDEFKNTIRRELDFNQEISHIERFHYNFKDDPDIHVPGIYKDLCSKHLIVLEYIEGHTLNDLLSDKNSGIDPKLIAKKGANFILKQIFSFGFFHADPHPGNILVLPDSRICFIDFGMTGSLPKKFRLLFADLILGFINQDPPLIVKVLRKFTRDDSGFDSDELEHRIGELVEEFTYMPLTKIDSKEVLQELLALLTQFKLKLPPVVYMLLKALVTIEGVARKLDPEFNISEYVKPFAKKLLKDKMDPLNLLKNNYPKAIDLVRYLAEFPGIAFEVSEMIRDGKINIGVEHKGLSPLIDKDRKNNKTISLAIISASIFLSSAIILAAEIPPFWHNNSILGLLGFILAGLLTFYSIRSGK